ncbi:MAG: dockerin type I domain-containing protein [Phycisphaerales bacterium]|nr:dockerin type I domain-containing protein [Phycisphaerales bacterium]
MRPARVDLNFNTIPDECEPTLGDTNQDGVINIIDLLNVISAWGTCPKAPAPCPADINTDGLVDVDDVLLVIAFWTQ